MSTADSSPAAIEIPPVPVAMIACSSTSVPRPYRFSLEQFERMIETEILGEQDSVELIDGEVVEKMVIGDLHSACVRRLNFFFQRLLTTRVVMAIQDPLAIGRSRPEPDVLVLQPRADFYAQETPHAEHVYLLIEVADSSLAYDRLVKAAIHARAGIADYWIVNLVDRVLEVHRQPQPDGIYGEVRNFQADESVAPLAFADVTVSVADLLP